MPLVIGIAVALSVGAFFALRLTSSGDGGPTQDHMADEIGAEVMRSLQRGHVPSVSGEITIVPKPYNYMAQEWDLRTLESNEPDTFTSHSAPWAHLARVPLVLYGRALDAEAGTAEKPVDVAQVAPTYARILGIEDFKSDGKPLPGIEYDAAAERPKVIVTVVIDGGGWNVLDEHPDSWPTLQKLMDKGVSFTSATIGSAPSITAPIHATLGAGSYPMRHGIPTNPAWNIPDLRTTAISETWDEANDNLAVVAATAFHATHLGMIGRGDNRVGGDSDIAALWKVEQQSWFTKDPYELPAYLKSDDLSTLEAYEEKLDGRDGKEDGLWFGHDLGELREPATRPTTPAFVRHHADATLEIVENENIGVDPITDFLWVEMKMPDYAGHEWNMVSPEVGDVLAEVDSQIGRLKREVSEIAGPDGYVLLITADHGQEPLAETTGGWRVNGPELERDLVDRFGDAVKAVTPTEIQIDTDAAENQGVELPEIASYVGDYTLADNIPEDSPGADLVPNDRHDERLFAGAFTTQFLRELRAGDFDSFGASDYAGGKLTGATP